MPVLRSLITALLLHCSFVPLGAPLGMVLCLGADGHIALEPVHERAKNASSPIAQLSRCQHTAGVLAGVDQHGPCTDVPLFTGEIDGKLIPASATGPKPEAPEALPALLLVPAYPEPPSQSIPPDCTPSPNHFLTVLRSVVLHI